VDEDRDRLNMRVIAGKLRGRPLRAPQGLTTRPTADRAREAIFQILGNLSDLMALDLYAGTGAMGIEAISRGARHAVFVEHDPSALRALRDNLARLGIAGQATLLDTTVERSRARLEKLAPFDLVLADAPWPIAQEAAERVAQLCRGLVATDGRVLLGHPTASPVELPESAGLSLADRRKWGGTGMSFYEIHSKVDDL
jgi:16S rRNA (guanine966-N2)-methyltransferase